MAGHDASPTEVADTPRERVGSGRWLTLGSLMSPLLYLPWGVGMIFIAYATYYLFGLEPESGESLASRGVLGWVANLLIAVALAVPSWVGAWLAVLARRNGAGGLSAVALLLNLLIGVAVVVFGAILPA